MGNKIEHPISFKLTKVEKDLKKIIDHLYDLWIELDKVKNLNEPQNLNILKGEVKKLYMKILQLRKEYELSDGFCRFEARRRAEVQKEKKNGRRRKV